MKSESRPYTSDATTSKIQLLQEHVYLLDNYTISIKEIAFPTEFSVKIITEKMKLLVDQNPGKICC